MKIEVRPDINVEHIAKKINGDEIGLFSANEWYRLTQPYMPRREGLLMQTVTVEPWQYTNLQPYSARLYFNPDYNFRKDKNPKAGGKWDERAIQEKQDEKLARAMQSWINKYI